QHDVNLFHAYADSENIRSTAQDKWKRNTLFASFPIGIETEAFAKASQMKVLSQEAQDLKNSLNGRKLILVVDRLDYSKGIIQRLKAIEYVLNENTEFH